MPSNESITMTKGEFHNFEENHHPSKFIKPTELVVEPPSWVDKLSSEFDVKISESNNVHTESLTNLIF